MAENQTKMLTCHPHSLFKTYQNPKSHDFQTKKSIIYPTLKKKILEEQQQKEKKPTKTIKTEKKKGKKKRERVGEFLVYFEEKKNAGK